MAALGDQDPSAPATRAYTLTGIHRDRLKLSVPFDIDIDLTDVDPEA